MGSCGQAARRYHTSLCGASVYTFIPYEGEFKDGQYHGQGKLTATGDFIFFDRLEYEGGFNNGEYNSQGSLNLYDYEEVLFFFKMCVVHDCYYYCSCFRRIRC